MSACAEQEVRAIPGSSADLVRHAPCPKRAVRATCRALATRAGSATRAVLPLCAAAAAGSPQTSATIRPLRSRPAARCCDPRCAPRCCTCAPPRGGSGAPASIPVAEIRESEPSHPPARHRSRPQQRETPALRHPPRQLPLRAASGSSGDVASNVTLSKTTCAFPVPLLSRTRSCQGGAVRHLCFGRCSAEARIAFVCAPITVYSEHTFEILAVSFGYSVACHTHACNACGAAQRDNGIASRAHGYVRQLRSHHNSTQCATHHGDSGAGEPPVPSP